MALLSPSLARLEAPLADSLRQMEDLGCSSVHVDVCSNLTIPNFFTVEELGNVRRRDYHASATVHLFQPFNDNPPNLTFLRPQDLVILHVFPKTGRPAIEAFLGAAHIGGYRPGLAVDINTQVTTVIPYLKRLDTIFVMAIQTGGYCLEPDMQLLDRIEQARALLSEHNPACRLGIDGGVNDKTFSRMARLADELVIGSLLLHAEDVPSQWLRLQAIAKGGKEGQKLLQPIAKSAGQPRRLRKSVPSCVYCRLHRCKTSVLT